jgi:two-component system cell cycle sensor histidine kinase/response regulator CckA
LLVEDETSLRTLTRNLLELCGYTVLEAKSTHDETEIGQQYSGTIHLLLTDVVMPGMNGRDLARQLSATRPEIKVLYESGYTGQSFSGRALDDQAHQCPICSVLVIRSVRRNLNA